MARLPFRFFIMMRFVYLFQFAFILPVCIYAQAYDNIWLFGYDSGPDTMFGGSAMDFNTIPPNIYYEYRELNFVQTNAVMSNPDGELQFYTNGISVRSSDGTMMLNGNGLNPGVYADDHAVYGYILDQGAMPLPDPGNENRYYLIHASLRYPNNGLNFHTSLLYYSLIDMSLEGGAGAVTDKNHIVVQDTLDPGKLTAVKHANGRDWWVLAREYLTNHYYRILVSDQGVALDGVQEIGLPTIAPTVGQAVFSPDGSKYVRFTSYDDSIGQFLDIYDFDRCTGLLSNHVQYNTINSSYAVGVAISPNSRYLYVSDYIKILQYDLQAPDIIASGQVVAEYDGFVDFLPTPFYLAQLAPDGKIYINVPNGVRYLHVIHQPNLPGTACMVEQHGIRLPTYNAFTIPNNPNYRLGPLDGSPCDDLGLDNHPVAKFRYDRSTHFPYKISFTDLSYYEPAEWGWQFGDGGSSTEVNPVHVFPSDGTYEVCLTVANEYGLNTYCQTVVIGTGISAVEEASDEGSLALFPNPANNSVVLKLPESPFFQQEGRVVFNNLMGVEVLSVPIAGDIHSLTLDVSILPTGIYLGRVYLNEKFYYLDKLVLSK
jgi:PKD domain